MDSCFKTFGCGSAIAASSVATEWVKGQNLDGATSIKNSDIAKHLSLPPVKLHCSMLAEDAIKVSRRRLLFPVLRALLACFTRLTPSQLVATAGGSQRRQGQARGVAGGHRSCSNSIAAASGASLVYCLVGLRSSSAEPTRAQAKGEQANNCLLAQAGCGELTPTAARDKHDERCVKQTIQLYL